jgi:hypothetical protein
MTEERPPAPETTPIPLPITPPARTAAPTGSADPAPAPPARPAPAPAPMAPAPPAPAPVAPAPPADPAPAPVSMPAPASPAVRDADLWGGRRPAPGLALLVDQVWPGRADGRVVLTLGEPPAGHRVVEQYAVMPRVESARMLVPVGMAAPASLLAYSQLRGVRTRVLKQATALAFRGGLGGLVARDRLSVCVPDGTDDEKALLLAHLEPRLDSGPLVAAIGVSEPAPNRKPTVQVFDRFGRPVGYVKVGWNEYTRGLVRHEAETLASLTTIAGDAEPLRPAVLDAGEWNGLELLTTAPLPASISPQSPDGWPDPALSLAVAGWGPVKDGPLGRSAYLEHLRGELELAGRHGSLTGPDLRDVTTYLDQVARDGGDVVLRFAAWHGDWSPWNLGTSQGRSWVWDWEHFGTGVPLGLDLAHYGFQRSFISQQQPVERALDSAQERMTHRLIPLGVDSGRAPLLITLYLAEALLRACRMHRLGAGWNPRFRSGALAAVRSRIDG